MHHATVDGVSGANLISHLCSLEPDAEPLGAQQEKKAWPHEPGHRELFGRGLVTSVTRPFTSFGLMAPTVQGVVGTIGRAREGTAMAAPLTAPRTSFNGTITGHRAIALAQMDLDAIKEVKAATGTTVNDVRPRRGRRRAALLPRGPRRAARQLAARDRPGLGPLGVDALRAPTRSRRCSPGSAPTSRTRWSGSRTWPPSNRNAKEHHKAISADALQDWAEFAAPRTFGLAVRAYASLRLAEKHPVVHNLVISNVPGPAAAALLHGRQDRGPAPARPGLPRRRPQHHGDVQQRPGRRRA